MAGQAKITAEDIQAVIDLIEKGATFRGACKKLGLVPRSIYLAANRLSIKMPSLRNKEKTAALVENYREQIESGEISLLALSRKIGMSQAYLSVRCKQQRIKVPGAWGVGRPPNPHNNPDYYEMVLAYLEENGGYIPQAIRELGLKCERHKVHKYAKEQGFDLEAHRYSNQMFGYWRILPGHKPERCYTADFRVKAVCTLCNTTHDVLMTNLRYGQSNCCLQCAHQRKVYCTVTCKETGQVYRSIRNMAKSIGLVAKYQTIKRRLQHKGKYEHDGKTYVLNEPVD